MDRSGNPAAPTVWPEAAPFSLCSPAPLGTPQVVLTPPRLQATRCDGARGPGVAGSSMPCDRVHVIAASQALWGAPAGQMYHGYCRKQQKRLAAR